MLLTSESVTIGHPDKICDLISDRILDVVLEQDPDARVAVETAIKDNRVWVFGELTTLAEIDVEKEVRWVLERIGASKENGLDLDTLQVEVTLGVQSPDIAKGVDSAGDKESELGAGDQGMMFGFAVNESELLLPLPIYLARTLADFLTLVRLTGHVDYLRPDGKTQVTVEYDEENRPIRIDTVVVSVQHSESVSVSELRKLLRPLIVRLLDDVSPVEMDEATKVLINPAGDFHLGMSYADSGLTGRKIIADTYGGAARHGGGAFSGKDGTKVDRSGAYMARHIAKNVVASGLANRCEVQLAYAIGLAEPVSIRFDVDTDLDLAVLEKAVRSIFPLTPSGMIEYLQLTTPCYVDATWIGHFFNQKMVWENVGQSTRLAEEYRKLKEENEC